MAIEALLLTVPEMAAKLKISNSKAWRMVYSRKIESVRIVGSVRIRLTDIQRLIDDNTTPRRTDSNNGI